MSEPLPSSFADRLGRGAIVAGGAAPAGWESVERVTIDDAVLRDPAAALDVMQAHWTERKPVVVDVRIDVAELRADETDDRDPYLLEPSFEFRRERLYFLARTNNYDARSGRLVWGLATEARRLGATPVEHGPGDVVLPNGRIAWLDGGPRSGELEPPAPHVLVHRVRIDDGSLAPDTYVSHTDAVLADDQQRAVLHAAGPARVIAPAGSGKTRVLTNRFRHLVHDRGWGSASVAAVAYNVRAKDEMQERLGDLDRAALRKVRTLHSLGNAIVRAGVPGLGGVLDDHEIRNRLAPLVPVRPRANTDVWAPYLDALTEVRSGLQSPGQVEATRDDVEGFAEAFEQYRGGLIADSVLDHDEQIYRAIEVLLRDPAVRRQFQHECRHLLVDEFQDLTPAQLLMLRLVAAPAYDVFGVGDDDQVIYSFAGANPEFLVRYDRYFPGTAYHDLEVNYRCPPAVVTAAAHLLSHNRFRVGKEIRAAKPTEGEALTVATHAATELPRAAVARVQSWLADGISVSDIAVLARVNAALLPVQVLCGEAGVPCWTAVTPAILNRTGMRAALAYLRLAVGLGAGAKLSGADVSITLRRPPRSIPRPVLERVERRQWKLQALNALGEGLSGRGAQRFDDYLGDLGTLGNLARSGATTGVLLLHVRDRIGLGATLEALDVSGRSPDASHGDDLNALIALASEHEDPATFEEWLRERLSMPADRSAEAMALSTVHRVKGMEWPNVVVLGAHEGLMPHMLADDDEEERRIFHVAITRSAAKVHVLAQTGRPTPFLEEMTRDADPEELARAAQAAAAREAPAQSRAAAPTSGVRAALGLEVTFAGSTGPIVELGDDGVLVQEPAGAQLRVPYYERVTLADGRHERLLPPINEALVEALKDWRRTRAKADGVPAYVVLHDSHIEDIAARKPKTLGELARCQGIGATKLDRYGDEIIAVVSSKS